MTRLVTLTRRLAVTSAIGLVAVLTPSSLMAAAEAFPPTEPGTSEIKTLPAGMLLKSEAPGSYFNNGGKLFRPLFRYISDHDIAMTTPVEAQIDDAAMLFWVAPSEIEKVAGSKNGVEVIEIPERTVAVRGAKGGYNEDNYDETRQELENWLSSQTEWRATGEAYGVYWNGPFTPWFLKRYEVQIPVERLPATTDLSQYQWKNRVLVVATPTDDDPAFSEQKARFAANADAMTERDLVVKIQPGADAFQVTLIGKDGGRKWRQSEPLDMDTLFSLIDGMPMRQSEMREQSR